ncbi:hypothetical protein CQA15_29475, partial [Klebsiella pneumoniae]|uniref:4-hydroxyphenylacetate 3-hydroxylase C-terminal domain-containing protein n=1 Tax=Klebsiella pneumoniae TaxID=573 RepID=UPI000BDA8C76
DAMVDLIKIVEGFFACGVAASVYCQRDPAGSVMPDTVFSNIGKLLLATATSATPWSTSSRSWRAFSPAGSPRRSIASATRRARS